MTDWALIAGGRCKQPWQVGIAGFDTNAQQVFLLSEDDWGSLKQQMPLEPLASYARGNGLSFERLTHAALAGCDGLLLIASEYRDQVVLSPAPGQRRYLVLQECSERDGLENEATFAKLFLPMSVHHYDERLISLNPHTLTDPACADSAQWAIARDADERDYSRLYSRSADFWIHRVTSAVAADAATVRGDEPLLSVIIPTYNYGRFLGQCIQSVLDQGVDDIEILVLDNASTDDTSQVMSAFAGDSRVRYMRNRYNYGPGFNWRNGMWIAKGRYITFLSADDYFNPGHLSSLLPTLERQPHVAVGYTSIRWVDGSGQPLNQPRHPGYRNGDYVGGRNEVADLLIHDCYMAPSAVIYRRKAFCSTWRPEKTYSAGDWEMVVQMAERYPDFVYVDAPGVSYRWHGGQESTRFYASSEPLAAHLAIVQGVFNRNAERCLRGREREVAAHISRRLALYPEEQHSALGQQARQLCERLEDLARLGEEALFSIILTTYNRPGLLRHALASLGEQSLRDFEVILVNDHGDPVESLLAEFDFPITYLYQGRNQGLSAARNAGLRLARGRYICYLDDDDLYLPEHLACLADAFERQPQSVVYAGVEYISERLEGDTRIELGRQAPFSHEIFDRERLFVQNYIPVNTWAHPRSMLAEVGEFDTSLTAFEDWDMLLRLAARYPFVHLPGVTAEVHLRDAPNTGSDHMLGREQKNFGALYQEMYRRHSDLGSDRVRAGREEMLGRFGLGDGTRQPRKAGLQDWLQARELNSTQQRLVDERLQEHAGGPCIGVVVLDLKGDDEGVVRTLESLHPSRNGYANLYPLLLSVGQSAKDWQGHRISVTSDTWVITLNQVLQEAECDWLVLVNPGETFTVNGLLMASLELLTAPDCRAVYCDQVYRQDNAGLGVGFRPAFNLDYLLSFPAGMAHHWLFRRDILLQAGGFDDTLPRAIELDMILRLINVGGLAGLGHIAEPLLITDAPVLSDVEDERLAILRHLQLRGYESPQIDSIQPGQYRIRYEHSRRPLVSVLLLAGSQLSQLQRCVESLLESTRYPHYELLLIESDPSASEVRDWLTALAGLGEARLRAVWPDESQLRAAAALNFAAVQAKGDFLLMLSPETAVIDDQWLDELVNHALRPEVGVVGAKLIASDGSIRHAGLVLGLDGPVGFPFVGEGLDAPGYMQRLRVDQDYSAVSRECLMIGRELYAELAGCADDLPDRYLDTDLCLRALQAGYLTVWAANAKLMLDASSMPTASAEEQDALYARWLSVLARDPAYNPNFSLVQSGGFKLADPGLAWRPLESWRPLPRVLAHPADLFGCGHYRIVQPFKALEDAGLVEGAMSTSLLPLTELERFQPDVILLQRQVGAERLAAMQRMKAFSSAFKVYELDDYLPNLPLKNAHRQHMPKDILRSLRQGFACVDRLVVSTEALAEAFVGMHERIRIVHNRLPSHWWGNLQSCRRTSARPRVGWAGGAGHSGDLEMIVDVVKELASEVDWVFFGMCPEVIRPFVKEFHSGVDITRYPQALAALNLDLALAPVEQNLFNECKSNLRLLEYGACGIPVICSDVRCYQDGLPVMRVKNRFRDWVDAIRMHITDLDACAQAGDALRSAVHCDWMLEGPGLQAWRTAWLPD
ncbi:glycosyltransferase [Pseudomonas sp. 8O]|uniref:glycosyltransferase n=1 Tax=Pseudomonas sp. 8O TaxID=2653165 RepID=UPI0012F0CA25|nr:glycosyltransferase [Pseudomonas sp. 8O]VXC28199.1 O-antigen biosynthesis protein [Pseudomonas sp. 8O]